MFTENANAIFNRSIEDYHRFDNVDQHLVDVDQHLIHVDRRLDVIEYKEDRTSKKLDDLQLDVKLTERNIRQDIHTLRDEMDTIIQLLKIHKIITV